MHSGSTLMNAMQSTYTAKSVPACNCAGMRRPDTCTTIGLRTGEISTWSAMHSELAPWPPG
jgi:hypothetical protein